MSGREIVVMWSNAISAYRVTIYSGMSRVVKDFAEYDDALRHAEEVARKGDKIVDHEAARRGRTSLE